MFSLQPDLSFLAGVCMPKVFACQGTGVEYDGREGKNIESYENFIPL